MTWKKYDHKKKQQLLPGNNTATSSLLLTYVEHLPAGVPAASTAVVGGEAALVPSLTGVPVAGGDLDLLPHKHVVVPRVVDPVSETSGCARFPLFSHFGSIQRRSVARKRHPTRHGPQFHHKLFGVIVKIIFSKRVLVI